MKHTTQDFAQAEFARAVDGLRAVRRSDVRSDEPWFYLTGNTIHRKSDEQMARGAWTPVIEPQREPKEPELLRLQNPQALAGFATLYGLRHDWHEPDESNISARIIGKHLDNAMGSTTRHEHAEWGGEFNVVLTRMDDTDREIQEDLAVVNLATLLSWAAQRGGAQR